MLLVPIGISSRRWRDLVADLLNKTALHRWRAKVQTSEASFSYPSITLSDAEQLIHRRHHKQLANCFEKEDKCTVPRLRNKFKTAFTHNGANYVSA